MPDEYGSATTSSPATGTWAASGSPIQSSSDGVPSAWPMTQTSVTLVPFAAALAVSRMPGTVTSSVAPASTSWWWISRSV